MYFTIEKRATGQYWWRAVGDNHEKLAHSEILSSKAACAHAIGVVKAEAASAPVRDNTGESAFRRTA